MEIKNKNKLKKRIPLTNGTVVNLRMTISDVASFNRYIIREHGNTMLGEDVFGKNPIANNVANCLYDELSGWLDNPNMLGLTILDISFGENRIDEEILEISDENTAVSTNVFNLIKFIGEIAAKDHLAEADSEDGAIAQLEVIKEKARAFLKGLPQTGSD